MVTGFFKKLTNKLFNSSSKLSKNLESAVEESAEVEETNKNQISEKSVDVDESLRLCSKCA